ncbi:hypothetical protein ZWY2020_037883 [Hordeum vulgare]|nr:hypothetical protein ZWY2020_037883 [Hordeum vulgare]
MKSWRAATSERLPARTALTGVPELVSLFSSSQSKVKESARKVCGYLERLEARTRELFDAHSQAYNELRTQHQSADGQIVELEVQLGEVAMERDALRGAGDRLQEKLALLQTEKKEIEAASRVELEQPRDPLKEKEPSYSADMDRLTSVHLREMELKDAALREKEGALVQMHSQLATALESAVTLQEEVARLTHAIKVRELEVLESAHETDGAFHRLFPVTQVVADTAVEVRREERRAVGPEVDTTSDWSVEEIGVGLRARLHTLGEPVVQFQVAGSSMVAVVWSDGVEPASMSRLARWLAAGDERLDVWCASATSAGAYMALRLAKSWYRNLDLGKLVAQRDSSEAELQALEAAGVRRWHFRPYDPDGSSGKAAHSVHSVAASSGAAYAESGADGSGSPREGDGATASGAAGDGEATTSGAAAGATDEVAAP